MEYEIVTEVPTRPDMPSPDIVRDARRGRGRDRVGPRRRTEQDQKALLIPEEETQA